VRHTVSVSAIVVAMTACRSVPVRSSADQADTVAAVWSDMGPVDVPDIDGVWVGGTGAEPKQRVQVAEAQCLYHPAAWALEQRGDTVFSYHFPESWEQGVARTDPPISKAPALGRVRRDTIYLRDGSETYVLRYDAVSGHLRGTRNGEPFWALRRQEIHREQCPAVP
jgi:hypothetical protein